MKLLLTLIPVAVLLLLACTPNENPKKYLPSHKYHYLEIDTSEMNVFGSTYIPVYSDIYHRDGTRRFSLTTTLSIRNISLADTFYVLSINYYDSHGALLREYLDSSIFVHPLESVEFVVEDKEKGGGAGANFIVEWAAARKIHMPLMQTVMIGTEGKQGISFCTDGVIIDYSERNITE